MALAPVLCSDRGSNNVVEHGCSGIGRQRYRYRTSECQRGTFIQAYSYRGDLPEVKQQIALGLSIAVGFATQHECSESSIHISRTLPKL